MSVESFERWLHHDIYIYIYVMSVESFERWLHHDIYIYVMSVESFEGGFIMTYIRTYIYIYIYVMMKPPFNGRCHKCDTWFVKL